MTRIFADSFYFIALLNPADRFHATAVETTERLSQPLVTTHWILVEVADALSAPRWRGLAGRFLERVARDTKIETVPPADVWYDRGLNLYVQRPDKAWSLTDCISFEVMREWALTEALTADHHFEQAGFRVLLQQP